MVIKHALLKNRNKTIDHLATKCKGMVRYDYSYQVAGCLYMTIVVETIK